MADTSADYLRHYLHKPKTNRCVTFMPAATYCRRPDLARSGIALARVLRKERKEKKERRKNRVEMVTFFLAVLLLTLA